MDGKATYNIMWFNPRTCEYITIDKPPTANTTDKNGKPAYTLPEKPNNDAEDRVITAVKNA